MSSDFLAYSSTLLNTVYRAEDYDEDEPIVSLSVPRFLLEHFLTLIETSADEGTKIDITTVTPSMILQYVSLLENLSDSQEMTPSETGSFLKECFHIIPPSQPSSQVSSSSSQIGIALTENAFSIPYRKAKEIANAIIAFANECLKDWNPTVYYSPYSPVVNGAIFGKSRAFMELPSHGVFVTTVSFQSVSSVNLPRRSEHLADWLLRSKGEAVYSAWIVATIDALVACIANQSATATIHTLAGVWAAEQVKPDFWVPVIEKAESTARSVPSFSAAAAAATNRLRQSLAGRKRGVAGPLKMLFFFDEASQF
jgi:hypothetical protein